MRLTPVLVFISAGCSGESEWQPSLPSDRAIAEAYATGLAASPRPAKVRAVCGPSEGHSAYLGVSGKEGWDRDAISKGAFVFAELEDGEHDLIFKDATGSYTSAAADGGVITASRQGGDLTLLVVYPDTDVIEVYRLTKSAGGDAMLIWTSSKGASAPLTKVSAMISRCKTWG